MRNGLETLNLIISIIVGCIAIATAVLTMLRKMPRYGWVVVIVAIIILAVTLNNTGLVAAVISRLNPDVPTGTVPANQQPTGTVPTSPGVTGPTLYTQVTQAPPTLDDPLSANGSNTWTETTTADGSSCGFSGGAYHVNASFPCLAEATNFGDLAYQVQMNIVKGGGGGIIFRAQNYSQYYTFYIDLSGNYTLKTSVDDTGHNDRTLSKGTSASIKTGLNQANLLTVIARGSSIYVYINGQFIASASDSYSTYRDGHIGVFGVTDVVFSHVQVWKL